MLDTGALLAFERDDPSVFAVLENARRTETPLRTTSGVAAQAWRDPGRQVKLSLLLRGVHEVPIDSDLSRRIGTLLAATGTTDVVGASIVAVCGQGDEVLTSDAEDLALLAQAAGLRLTILPI